MDLELRFIYGVLTEYHFHTHFNANYWVEQINVFVLTEYHFHTHFNEVNNEDNQLLEEV